jgi:hypothetical protein
MYPKIGKAGRLGLRISGTCCRTTDVAGAVVTSSATLGAGGEGGTMAGATTGPGRRNGGSDRPLLHVPPAGGR